MTLLESTTRTTVPAASAHERAARLTDAGSAWGERISNDTAAAHLTYKVSAVGEGSVASRVTVGRHEFLIDEPASLAGDDVAASPVEFALGALISCQIVVYRLYAHALGIEFDDITINAEGELDVRKLFGIEETVRPGFGAVRLDVVVTGPETEERYQQLKSAVDEHCPVLDLFANATPVEVAIRKG
jgi:putative redox protein